MADEPTTTPVDPAEPVVPAEPDVPAEPADPVEQKLDRIVAQRLGKYAERTRRAEEEARQLRDEVQQLRGAVQQPKPPAQAPTYWTQDQLQAAVDRGQITPAQMAGHLALQAKQEAKHEVKQELRAELLQETRRSAALTDVRQYMEKVPALEDPGSADFHRVARVANEIAEEMGSTVQDPRVQRLALKQVYGSLDTLTRKDKAREFNRQNADTHVEPGRGAGAQQPPTTTKDPLKDVEPARLEHWRKLGYTRKQMEDEAAFIRRPLRAAR